MFHKLTISILALTLTITLSGIIVLKQEITKEKIEEVKQEQQLTEDTNNQNERQGDEDAEVLTSDIDTSNWKTYRNEEYGFEFKYPEELGDLEEKIVYGDSGSKFSILTKNKPTKFVFSGITSDYSVPRGSTFGNSQGYLIDGDGNYNMVINNSNLIPFSIKKIIIAPIGNVVVVDPISLEYNLISPGRNNIGALVNLNSDVLKGLSLKKISDHGLSDGLFYKIIETMTTVSR